MTAAARGRVEEGLTRREGPGRFEREMGCVRCGARGDSHKGSEVAGRSSGIWYDGDASARDKASLWMEIAGGPAGPSPLNDVASSLLDKSTGVGSTARRCTYMPVPLS